LQFCFQISVNLLHVDGIFVIHITVLRLFSQLAAIYITDMEIVAPVSQHLAGYILLVDQLSEIVIYVRSFGVLQSNVFCATAII